MSTPADTKSATADAPAAASPSPAAASSSSAGKEDHRGETKSEVTADGMRIETNWDQVVTSFDDMHLKDELLRGIYAYGFEKPSAIQQRG